MFSGTFDLPFGEEEAHAQTGRQRKGGFPEIADKILGHIELAPIVTVESGRPVNTLTGLDSNHSHAFPFSSRPLGFERNTLQTPGNATVDLRAVRYFPFGGRRRLDFELESFNLCNHWNVSQINAYFGGNLEPLPGFGRPIAAFNARQMQLSVDYEF